MPDPPTLETEANDLLAYTTVHQQHVAEQRALSGERFNIFNIVRMGHYEVKTHSPILAELLDPQGIHDQGDLYLKLFMRQFRISEDELDSMTAQVFKEHYAGPTSALAGGRIDILIRDAQGIKVVIENKIYAGDQAEQIQRYRNRYPTARILYLTLFGSTPGNVTEEQRTELKCECVSYQSGILTWLEECIKESAGLPTIRETLVQYVKLVRELTQQSTTCKMNTQLIQKILQSETAYSAFLYLAEARSAVEAEIVKTLLSDLSGLASSLELKFQESERHCAQKEGGFEFHSDLLSSHNLRLCFQFQERDYRILYFGFCKINKEQPCTYGPRLRDSMRDQYPEAESGDEWWPAGAYVDGSCGNWRLSHLEVVRSGEFLKAMEGILESLKTTAANVLVNEVEA